MGMPDDEDDIPFYVKDADAWLHEACEVPAEYVQLMRDQGRIGPMQPISDIPRRARMRQPGYG